MKESRHPTPGPTTQRLESLDSIRGLAALAVLFGHDCGTFVWPVAWVYWTRWPLFNIAFDGRSAVAMFFVLSGFVLSRSYVSLAPAPLNVPAFYVRRLLRIWLPWFCAFAVGLACRCWLFQPHATQPPGSHLYWQHAVSGTAILQQCVFQLHDAPGQIMPQDWSLGVELIGSALIPFFVIVARRRWHWLWFGLLGTGFFFLINRGDYFNSGSYYVSFILGVLLARHHDRLVAKMKQSKLHFRLAVLLAGVALYEARRVADHLGWNTWTADRITWVICSVGCVLIMAASLSSRRMGGFLTTGPVLWVGRISYSVYLLQFIPLLCILPATFAWLNRLGVGPSLWMLPFSLFIGLVITLALSWLFYRYVEVPSIELGRRASAKLKKIKLSV